jgi:hypothetical protein
MSDLPVILFRVSRIALRATMATVLLTTAVGLGGCAGGAANNSFAMASNTGVSTIAFESIDGPPPQVFDRMVGILDSESKLRSLSIVSREGTAAFRVRSYFAAEVSHGRTTIAWVWDVYDQNQQRALRLSGEEQAGKAGRDAWASADDLVLRKIAQSGLSGLAGMINGTSPADAPQPAPPGSFQARTRGCQRRRPHSTARGRIRRRRPRLYEPLAKNAGKAAF